jgi:tRNA nucleotidyltransferase (CCA-adding enzyme)
MTQELADKFDEIERIIDTILEEEQCFSIKDLAVTGRDIIDMGAPEGKLIGSILSQLLDKVIEGELPNKKGPLLQAAAQLIESAE